jgi:hypothetical protein
VTDNHGFTDWLRERTIGASFGVLIGFRDAVALIGRVAAQLREGETT